MSKNTGAGAGLVSGVVCVYLWAGFVAGVVCECENECVRACVCGP